MRVGVRGARAALHQLGLVGLKVSNVRHGHVHASVGLARAVSLHDNDRGLVALRGGGRHVQVNHLLQRDKLRSSVGAGALLPVPTHNAAKYLVANLGLDLDVLLQRGEGLGEQRGEAARRQQTRTSLSLNHSTFMGKLYSCCHSSASLTSKASRLRWKTSMKKMEVG